MSADSRTTGLFSIAVLGSGNVIGTVISAIALILFSRFMGPAEFGLFSAGFAAMQIIVRLADLGTNMATERAIARVYASDHNLASRLIGISLWLKLISYFVWLIAGLLLTPFFAQALKLPDVFLLQLALVLALGTIFFEYSTVVFQATHHFALVARITIAQAVGKLLFGILAIWQGFLTARTGLLIYGILPGIGALSGWLLHPFPTLVLPPSWKKDLRLIVSVAKWTGMAAIAATLADNIDTLLVQTYLTSYDTGIWSGAVRIASFASLVGWSIGAVLNIRVARYHQLSHLRQYLSKAWKISLGAFGLIILSLLLASFAIQLTIGSAYLSAITPLQILLAAAALAAATSPFVALFYLFDKPQYYALTGVLQTAILIIGDILLIPRFGLVGAAWVRVMVRVTVLLFTLIYARSAYVEHYRSHDRKK